MFQRRPFVPLALAFAMMLAGCGRGPATATLVTSAGAKGAAGAVAADPSVPTIKPTVSLTRGELTVMPDEVIVKFKDAARDLAGATRLRDLPLPNTVVYKVTKSGFTLQDAEEEWDTRGDIDYIEPNYMYEATAMPTDPRFSDSWGVGAINAPSLWTFTTGVGVKVAVVDTGVDARHADLLGRVLPGVDFVNDDNDATDDHGHGTHVAGTIAAIANNGIDVAGVAPGAQIIPIKVLNKAGQGYNADIANGVLKAADLGAKVINMSLGGAENSETLRRAIENVQARGCIVVAAAGNDGVNTPFYPAANEGVIAVAAVDSQRRKASFSNYGSYVDVAAPGVSIGSTKLGGGVASMNGTSMASPHVAGAVALLLGQFPQLKAAQLTKVLQLSGHPSTGFVGSAPPVIDVEEAFVRVPTLDMQAPSVVTGLTATTGAPGEVALHWNAASDNSGSVSYRILRDGQAAGTAATPAFTDRGVGARASYRIVAIDGDGNESAPSAAAEVTPSAASTMIQDLVVASRSSTELTFTLRTTEPMRCFVQYGETDQLGQGTGWETVPSLDHTITLSGLKRFKNYHYRVVAATNASAMQYTDIRKARTKLFWLFSVE